MSELVSPPWGPAYVKRRAASMDSFLQLVKPSHKTLPHALKCPGCHRLFRQACLKSWRQKKCPRLVPKGILKNY